MHEIRDKLRHERAHLHEKSKRGFLHFLFGRSTLILLLLAAQVFLLIGLFARWQFSAYAYGLSYVLSAFMAVYLLNRPMNATSRQTWLILILLLPVLGTLLYIYVDMDIGHRLVRGRLEQIGKETDGLLPRQERLMEAVRIAEPELHSLANYTLRVGGFPIYTDTHVDYFPQGEDKFPALLEALERAEKFIFMEYFIIDEGYMWGSVLEILARKARRGRGRAGALRRHLRRIPSALPLSGSSCAQWASSCKMFAPIRPAGVHPLQQPGSPQDRRDRRTHGLYRRRESGGRVHQPQAKSTATGRTRPSCCRGPAVRSFTLMFLQMWHVTEWKVEYAHVPERADVRPRRPSRGFVLPYGDNPFDDERVGEASLPGHHQPRRALCPHHDALPDHRRRDDLRPDPRGQARRGRQAHSAAHSRQKVGLCSLAYTHYRELLRAGVQIFEYTPGFVHAKVFVSDDEKAVVGTINLDYRCFVPAL